MAEMNNFRKLPPEDRIRRLKEMEEERKKEIEEMEKAIDESENELRLEEQLRQKVPVSQLRAASASELQTEEERQIFAAHRGVTATGLKGHGGETVAQHTRHAGTGLESIAEETPEMTDRLRQSLREGARYQNILAQKEAGGGVKYDITGGGAHREEEAGDIISQAYKAKTGEVSYKAVTENPEQERNEPRRSYRTRGF